MSQVLERHHCNRCGHETDWAPGRTKAVCTGCRTQFPCSGVCTHYDCREARGEVKCCLECRVIDGHLTGCGLYVKPVDSDPPTGVESPDEVDAELEGERKTAGPGGDPEGGAVPGPGTAGPEHLRDGEEG